RFLSVSRHGRYSSAMPAKPRKTVARRGRQGAGSASRQPRKSAPRQRRRTAVRQFDGQILELDEKRIPLVYRQDHRARAIILRFDRELGHLVVVLPKRTTPEAGRRFALKNRDWIVENAARLPRPVPFAAGRVIPFLGQPHRIRHWPTARGVVWLADGEIHVAEIGRASWRA